MERIIELWVNRESSCTFQLCITLNNIEHVRQYLKELPVLLDWESVCMLLSTKHENDDIGNKAISTLSRLIQSTQQEILMKCYQLITRIGEKMKIDMARFMELFTQKTPEKASVSQWIIFPSLRNSHVWFICMHVIHFRQALRNTYYLIVNLGT